MTRARCSCSMPATAEPRAQMSAAADRRSSRVGDRRPVAGHDLRLVREYFAALRVNDDLQPVDVVVPVRLVVPERLHAGEVFKAAALRIEKRLVNPEIVGVAVYVRHGLP